MSYPNIAQQTIGEPLANPWYTAGWTAQVPDYQVIPKSIFNIAGFPSSAIYVTVSGNFFDDDGNPLGGHLTFYPSSALTMTSDSATTVMPQRFVGTNLFDVAGAFWGTGKMYLRNGKLLVSLLATDNSDVSMSPVSFTYHVVEHWLGGREYDILVPSTSINPVDINSLIIPGSVNSDSEQIIFSIASISTEFLSADISAKSGGVSFDPTSDEVDFAFISGPTEPQSEDWNAGSWVSGGPPYIAEILIGPDNSGLILAKGSYIVWCKVVTTSQVPKFSIGTLIIY